MFYAFQRTKLGALMVLMVLLLGTIAVNPFGSKKKGSSQKKLAARELEFIFFTQFPVYGKGQCEEQCKIKVYTYRHARMHMNAGPHAHHHCNLGWMLFGWRFLESELPPALDGFVSHFRSMLPPQDKGKAPLKGSEQKEPASARNKAKDKQDNLNSKSTTEKFAPYMNLIWDQMTSFVQSSPSASEQASSTWAGHAPGYCSTSAASTSAMGGCTMTGTGSDWFLFRDILVQVTAMFLYADDKRQAKTASIGSTRRGSNIPPKTARPTMCFCEIGVIVENALVPQEPLVQEDTTCVPVAFAALFPLALPGWVLKAPDGNVVLSRPPVPFNADRQFATPWQMMRRWEQRPMYVRAEGPFNILLAQRFAGLWRKPFQVTRPPVSLNTKAWYHRRTLQIEWNPGSSGPVGRCDEEALINLSGLTNEQKDAEMRPPPDSFV